MAFAPSKMQQLQQSKVACNAVRVPAHIGAPAHARASSAAPLAQAMSPMLSQVRVVVGVGSAFKLPGGRITTSPSPSPDDVAPAGQPCRIAPTRSKAWRGCVCCCSGKGGGSGLG